jgi:hypothetical protein
LVAVNPFDAGRSVRTPRCKLFGHDIARAAKRSSFFVAVVIVGNGIARRSAVRLHDDTAFARPEKSTANRPKVVLTSAIVNDDIERVNAIVSRIILPSRVSP